MYEFILYTNLVVWTALCLDFARRPQASAFHPIIFYLAFEGVIFVLRPFLALYLRYDGIYALYSFVPSAHDKIVTIAITMFASVVFYFAALRFGNATYAELLEGTPTWRERANTYRSFLITSLILGPPALYSLVLAINTKSSDTSTMIIDAATGTMINTTSNGYISDLQLLMPTLLFMLVWISRYQWWSLIPSALYCLAKAATGGRWSFVVMAIALGLGYLFLNRRRWVSLKLFPPAAIVFTLFVVVGVDRGGAIRTAVLGEQVATYKTDYFEQRPMEGMDFANMEYLEYLVYVVPQRSHTYDYFLGSLQVFTEPVPRVLWHGKPVGPPIPMVRLWNYGTPIGMTQSMAGTGWVAAGWIGVAIWAALFALCLGKCYQWFVRNSHREAVVMSFLMILAVTAPMLRDGVLVSIVKMIVYTLAPILCWRAVAAYLDPVPDEDERLSEQLALPRRSRPPLVQSTPVVGPRNRGAAPLRPRNR